MYVKDQKIAIVENSQMSQDPENEEK